MTMILKLKTKGEQAATRMSRRTWGRSGWLWGACLAVLACRPGSATNVEPREHAASPPVARDGAGEGLPDDGGVLVSYPPGRWRMAAATELEHVVLWASHILIRHQDAEQSGVSFSLADWVSQPPPEARSRAAALALAREILGRAQRGAEPFDVLAARYSEDLSTKERGGSLGGVTASMLAHWPQVLDALAAIKPGQPSRIVETRYGFHILLCSPPPVEEQIAGAHIVVGHRDAGWLRYVSRGEAPTRSHSEALARARDVRERVERDPSSFVELVAQYSEHRDAAQHGDMGEWSTLEPTPFPRELDVLRKLRVGEVSEPLETLFGVQVLLRTPLRPRAAYATDVIRIPYDSAREAGQPRSKEAQRVGSQTLLETLLHEPERFLEVQRELNGRVSPELWTEGRGPFGLRLAVEQIGIGQIGAQLVELDETFWIIKRLAPAAVVPKQAVFELPVPERPDLDGFAMYHPDLPGQLRAVMAKATGELETSAELSERLRALHDAPAALDEQGSPEERLAWFHHFLRRSRELLGGQAFERYQRILDEHVSGVLLAGAGPL